MFLTSTVDRSTVHRMETNQLDTARETAALTDRFDAWLRARPGRYVMTGWIGPDSGRFVRREGEGFFVAKVADAYVVERGQGASQLEAMADLVRRGAARGRW